MADVVQRFEQNPLIRPSDVPPSRDDFEVACVLNPGAFEFEGRIGLLLRVAERPPQSDDVVRTPVNDPERPGNVRILEFRRDDPDLEIRDSRAFRYRGRAYLTTLSHLRLAWSEDGVHFEVEPEPVISGEGPLETFGVEDCRVTRVDDRWVLTYTAVSESGVGIGLITTGDWRRFERHGMVIPPHNKDCAVFPERVDGEYVCLHRPSGVTYGGNFIWLARSPDLDHWGGHVCLAHTRPGMWDSARVGAGAAPIRTDAGWLEIYHGADERNRYCLGALLLDPERPDCVLARSREPIMTPEEPYEKTGFFGNVVFTNGHVQRGDELLLYYGAADEYVCGGRVRLSAILDALRRGA